MSVLVYVRFKDSVFKARVKGTQSPLRTPCFYSFFCFIKALTLSPNHSAK
jgi:hypothetical protein